MNFHNQEHSKVTENKLGHKLGAALPIICAVHCAITPFFLTSLPLLGIEFLASDIFEWLMILGSLVFAIYVISKDTLQSHKNWTALYIALFGFVFVIAAHTFHHFTTLLSLIGAGIILVAYGVNWKFVQGVKKCSC